jgi:MATE family multidrug resistance protein
LCLAGIAFVPGALEAVGYGARVRELMASYLQVRFLTGGAAVGLEALGNYYGGIGNTRLPMFAQVLAMVLNVVFCWMFIQGHWGAPALGVMGSGLAAALATGIAFVALLACFLLHVGAPHPSVTTSTTPSGQASTSQLTWHELWRMLRFGLPSGFNWFIEFAAFSVFINIVVAGLGTTALAAMMSVMQLNSIAFMPAFGLATAGSIFVGQAIGAKVPDDVPRTVALTLGVTIAWQGLAAICYLTIPRLLLRPFMNDDVATNDAGFLEVGARVLMLSAAWQVFDAVASTLSEALRAAGDTAFSFWARAIIAWVVFVPGAVLSVRYFGAGDVGVVSWLVVYLGLLALTLAVRFRGGRWRTLELIEGSMH